MNYLKLTSLLFFIFWITPSCVPKLKGPPDLAVNVPQSWISEEASVKVDLSRWWTRFNDSKLNAAIEQVLSENYDLKAALARVDAAASLARIAGADLYPGVSGSFSALRQKQNFVGFPFLDTADGVPSSTSSVFGVSMDVVWEIDLWGRLRATKAAAVADFQASKADLIGFQLSLAGQAAKAWYAAVEAELQVRLAEATLSNYRETNDQVWLRYKRGLRPSLDVRLSESNVATAESVLTQRKDHLQRIKRQIEVLLGRYPASRIALSESLPAISEPVPAGIPADIVRRRPDLISAEKRLTASHARLIESRRALYPRISLTGSGGTSSDELSNLLDGDYSVWNLIGNLIQPLFQGGRLRAGVKLAQAREQEALARYAQSVLSAYAEVETSLATEKHLEQREKAVENAAEQATAARQLAQDRYAKGLTNLIEVLEAQRRSFDSQSQLLSLRRQRVDNRIDLYLALGGDFIASVPESSDLEGKESR